MSDRSFLRRWRAPLVVIPLLAGLGYAALVGGRMLWAEIPKADPASRPVVCWDGTESPRADCPVPSGAAGLAWVFPSFAADDATCSATRFPDDSVPRPTQFDCKRRVQGSAVTVSYSQRSTLAGGQRYFLQRYPGLEPTEEAGGERLLYRDAAPRGNGRFEVTETYAQYPYAVSVTADTLDLADRALESLVEFRPAAFVVVRPDE